MAKKEKKIDVKKVAKVNVSNEIAEFLREKGYDVNVEAASFGFTEGTILVSVPETDIQVKFITPKAGITKYEVLADEVETVE